MMMDDHLIADEHKRYLGIIERASETMLNIIQDILNLEQLRSTEMPNERVPLAQLTYDVIGQHEPEMTAKHQAFSFKIQPHLPMMIGRPTQLAQVVSNLLSNAIKYTPNGGKITLNLYQPDPHHLRLEVQDTGYGIPKDAQKKLFTEFYRVRTKETAHIPGTGLGLSLIKTVVEAHNGRIWVESEVNQGSTFFVEFPIETDEQVRLIAAEDNTTSSEIRK
jgi:signal transduction histidine kinase